ncbi:MAG: EAL domain-containing protein [Desulfuromonadales bacterium]
MLLPEDSTPLRLEGRTKDGSHWVVPVNCSPFIIGRKEGSDLFLASEGVSRKHAEIVEVYDGWLIRDSGSTNGTYINGKRLSADHLLQQGDYITIAEIRFDVVELCVESECTEIINPYAENLEQMLDLKAVDPHFQPLISLINGSLIGYEVLGRINFVGLPNSPRHLFEISGMLGRQVELSELFRNTALKHAAAVGVTELILFNTLPDEMNFDILRPSLSALRQLVPDLKLGMELHENTVTDAAMMKELRELLYEQEMLLVYDDFGAGQSRLIELLDSVPDILKFDIALIHGIQHRSKASRSIVETLVKMAGDAGIRTLAEGIESVEEAEVCREIGFELGQGYFLGRPAPLQS